MTPEQIAAIERLRELDRRVGYWQWGQDEQFSHHVLYDDGFCFSVCETDSADALPTHAEFIVTLRNEALPLIEALQQSLSEAQADARVFSGSYNALAVDFGRLKEELQETQDDKLYVDSESQMLINENNQLKAENERLKSEAERTDKAFSKTLKDLTFSKRESKKFCDLMMKNVNKCCEFQNEIERLREGIGRALAKMKGIADCAEQLEESAEQEFFKAIEELEALHDA